MAEHIRTTLKFIQADREVDDAISAWHLACGNRATQFITTEAEALAKLSLAAYRAMTILLGEDGVLFLCVTCFSNAGLRGVSAAYLYRKHCSRCKKDTWCTRYKKPDSTEQSVEAAAKIAVAQETLPKKHASDCVCNECWFGYTDHDRKCEVCDKVVKAHNHMMSYAWQSKDGEQHKVWTCGMVCRESVMKKAQAEQKEKSEQIISG